MCGISAAWGYDTGLRKKVETNFAKRFNNLMARGPDSRRISVNCYEGKIVALGFCRLAIQGTGEEAEQPFVVHEKSRLLVNGEIYNAKKLGVNTRTASDCVAVRNLLESGLSLVDVCRQLDGDFAIIHVISGTRVQLARDPYGVRPLFYARDANGSHAAASEMKGLWGLGEPVEVLHVEPGTVLTVQDGTVIEERFHQVPWLKNPQMKCPVVARSGVFAALKSAVKKRLHCNESVEIGACLSGGLDSSIVCALAVSLLARDSPTRRLKTYCLGMTGSPDVEAARTVAAFLGTEHHEITVTEAECLAAIPEVIWAIESYDVTTVRASVANYLVGRYIKEKTPGVKVVLNGDGSDEVFGGYRYMLAAPSDRDFELETTRLLENIHCYDVLRSERSMAAHGLESRSPFLDRQFVAMARSIPTHMLRSSKTVQEKFLLRSVFILALPLSTSMRPKEAFSDGISTVESSWYETAKRAALAQGFGEAQLYLNVFRERFGEAEAKTLTAQWMPRFITGATDPSARTLAM